MATRFTNPPYAFDSVFVNGVIIVDRDTQFDDNPLFYVNSEYPKYKYLDERGFFVFDYEFYTDKAGNRYMVVSNLNSASFSVILSKLSVANWNMARNVDDFVNGADKEEFEHWLESIS